jgi:hypothetical protein
LGNVSSSSGESELDPPVEDAIRAVIEINGVLNVVIMEGPAPVAEAAAKLQDVLTAETSDVLGELKENAGEQKRLFILAEDRVKKAVQRRARAKGALIAAAKEALGTGSDEQSSRRSLPVSPGSERAIDRGE